MNEHMQFLAREPFSAPPALAREHWKPFAKAHHRFMFRPRRARPGAAATLRPVGK